MLIEDQYGVGDTVSVLEIEGVVEKVGLRVTTVRDPQGTLCARSATLMTLALPGGTYLYQGEELGLPEVRDLPEDRLTDPRWKMSGYQDRGRDGCRVPLPWSSDPKGGFGFSTNDALKLDECWLPQSPWMGKCFAIHRKS